MSWSWETWETTINFKSGRGKRINENFHNSVYLEFSNTAICVIRLAQHFLIENGEIYMSGSLKKS